MVAGAAVAVDFDTLKNKSVLFFDNKEWASAEAMCQLMVEERPADVEGYTRGIVAAGMSGDVEAQMRFLQSAVENRVPFKQLFGEVQSVSFGVGNSTLYEQFLLHASDSFSWMSRIIDSYLLDYYAFRRDPQMMLVYANKMKSGVDNNVNYMLKVAEAEMLEGDVEKSITGFEHIVENYPNCYEALLYCGIYYYDKHTVNDDIKAKEYLEKAYAQYSTPYVENMLNSLNKRIYQRTVEK